MNPTTLLFPFETREGYVDGRRPPPTQFDLGILRGVDGNFGIHNHLFVGIPGICNARSTPTPPYNFACNG
eukprot:scaffold5357_cov208-Amphora_coffeaeformis.AAC.8